MSRFGNLEFGGKAEESGAFRQVYKDATHYWQQAEAAFTNGQFEQALRAYSKVLEFDPQHVGAWTGQVRMLIELGEFQEAKLWADKAIERFPNEPELLSAKAVALGRIGDFTGALAFSDAAMGSRGETPYVWLARGDVLLSRSEKRADFCFDKALQLGPGNWIYTWLASRIHYYYQKFSLALKYAQQAISLNASLSIVWLQVGECQLQLGLVDMARNSFEQARQLNPQCVAAHEKLTEISHIGFWPRLFYYWRRLFSST